MDVCLHDVLRYKIPTIFWGVFVCVLCKPTKIHVMCLTNIPISYRILILLRLLAPRIVSCLISFLFVFLLIYKKERGASLMLVPRCVGLRIALSVETSNAESPTLMQIYNMPYCRQTTESPEDNDGCI